MARRITRSFPATFVRGGTSSGLVIDRGPLPPDQAKWQPLFSSAMGSPDPYGRQLNGIGSGISSTSKICVISSTERDDADVDFTFVQVGIKDGVLDLADNCGNLSSAVRSVAWNESLLKRKTAVVDTETTVRIYNTNTAKIIYSSFQVGREERKYQTCGGDSIDGVPGLDQGSLSSSSTPLERRQAKRFRLATQSTLWSELESGDQIQASLVDVSNPGVFVLASDVGVPGNVWPDELSSGAQITSRLERIRQIGAAAMGLDPNTQTVPKIVMLSSSLNGDSNIVCRILSMQQVHKTAPFTLAMNPGAACSMPGTLAARIAVGVEGKWSVAIEHASGKLEVRAVSSDDGKIERALLYRTARVLMKGEGFYTVE